MVQEVSRGNGVVLKTTRCPVRIDGKILKSSRGAPRLGEQTEEITKELIPAARKEVFKA
jgi:CoA:oxalate CoA-transferase